MYVCMYVLGGLVEFAQKRGRTRSPRKQRVQHEANTKFASQDAWVFCVFDKMHACRYCTSDAGARQKKQKIERESRTKIQQNSSKSRSHISDKSTKIDEKFDVLRFWALEADLGTRREVLGTCPGRPKAASEAILGRLGRAKGGRETSKSLPGPIPRHFQTAVEPCLSMFSTKIAVKRACEMIFRCFCFAARKLEA